MTVKTDVDRTKRVMVVVVDVVVATSYRVGPG
jgi:hypothetical protein